jgi:hypothetical protein
VIQAGLSGSVGGHVFSFAALGCQVVDRHGRGRDRLCCIPRMQAFGPAVAYPDSVLPHSRLVPAVVFREPQELLVNEPKVCADPSTRHRLRLSLRCGGNSSETTLEVKRYASRTLDYL